MKIEAPPEVTERVRARLRRAAEKAGRASEFWRTFPHFERAVAELPALEGLYGTLPELTVTVLDAYRMEGHPVDPEVWRALGVERFA